MATAAELEAQRRAAAQARDKFKKGSAEWNNANKKVEAIRKQIQSSKGSSSTSNSVIPDTSTPEAKAKTREEISGDLDYWGNRGEENFKKYYSDSSFAELPTDVNAQVLDAISKAEGRTNMTEDERASLDALKQTFQKTLTRDPGVQASLDALKSTYEKSLTRDPEVQRSLDLLDEMTKGMDSKVLQAQREEAQLAQDSDYATQAQALRRQMAVSGARGAQQAAMQAQLDKARQDAGRSFERQLLTDNLNFTNSARNNYFGAVNTTQQREANTRQSAANAYWQGNETTTARENTDRINASNNLSTGTSTVNKRLDDALGVYAGLAKDRQNYQTAIGQYNTGQSQARDAARIGSVLGMQGTGTGLMSNAEADAYNKNMLEFLKAQQEQANKIAEGSLKAYETYLGKM